MSEPKALSPADLYRLLHTGNAGDLDFYLRAAGEPCAVLELGMGWGRLSLALARAGHRVVGVDNDASFVAQARADLEATQPPSPRADFLVGDARSVVLAERFDRVFVPYNTLYALGGREAVVDVFRTAARHLTAEGELWFDAYSMDEFHRAAVAGEAPNEEGEREEVLKTTWSERELVVFETTNIDLGEQRLDVVYEAEADGTIVGRGSLTHHYLLTSELVACLEQAGLELAGLWGGFGGQAADEDAEQLVVCAVLPPDVDVSPGHVNLSDLGE